MIAKRTHKRRKGGEITAPDLTDQNKEKILRKRPLKFPENAVTDALYLAIMAIGQLERIRNDDPKWQEAFNKVMTWIKHRMN